MYCGSASCKERKLWTALGRLPDRNRIEQTTILKLNRKKLLNIQNNYTIGWVWRLIWYLFTLVTEQIKREKKTDLYVTIKSIIYWKEPFLENMNYNISKFVAISKLHNPIILHAQVSAGLFLVPLQLHQASPHHQVPHVAVVGGVVVPGRALDRNPSKVKTKNHNQYSL